MKEMHRLIVTSETYKLASAVDPAIVDVRNRRSIRTTPTSGTSACGGSRPSRSGIRSWPRPAPGPSLGGPSFDITAPAPRRGGRAAAGRAARGRPLWRTAARPIMIRGYSTSRDVVPNFLQAFDVDDGRLPCPMRTRTVTAPQGLFLMNSDEIDKASRTSPNGCKRSRAATSARRSTSAIASPCAVSLPPARRTRRLTYLKNDPQPAEGPGVAALQPG